jgi:glycosyltransferase involved in cell wall biosynthesis
MPKNGSSLNSDAPITVNARFHVHRKTGMQKYAHELASRFNGQVREIRPDRPLKGPLGHLWEQCYLPKLASGSLLWSPNNTGPVVTRRQVCTIHDVIPIDHPEWFSAGFSSWYRWLMPLLARSAQHLIAVSEFTRSRLIELFSLNPAKVSVVLNGIGPEFAPREGNEISRTKQRLGIAGPYVLYVGSLEPRKNLARLLSAWDRVQKQCGDVQLVITGLNKASSSVFSAVHIDKIPPRVTFTGYVEDEELPALYSGASVFVYPSLYEGFGLPPAEAMACGTPVITSGRTSLPEVVGTAAVLVDPEDADSIGAAIARVVNSESLRAQLRADGIQRAKRFQWDTAAKETWAILCREKGRQ